MSKSTADISGIYHLLHVKAHVHIGPVNILGTNGNDFLNWQTGRRTRALP